MAFVTFWPVLPREVRFRGVVCLALLVLGLIAHAEIERQEEKQRTAFERMQKAAEARLDLAAVMFDRTSEQKTELEQAAEDLISAGNKMADVIQTFRTLEDIRPKPTVERTIEAARMGFAILPQGGEEARRFAEAMVRSAAALQFSNDVAGGYVLAQRKLGVEFGQIGPAAERARREILRATDSLTQNYQEAIRLVKDSDELRREVEKNLGPEGTRALVGVIR